jgi:hypothetical protein
MNRVWVGVAAGVIAATALLGVGIGAYRAGQDDDHVTRIVTEQGEGEGVRDGEVVRVVERDGWRGGPHFGFFLFPLLIVGGIFLIARGGRRHWGHGYGYGYGPGYGGPGRWGPPEDRVREWHRHLHEEDERLASPTPASGSSPESQETSPPDAP